MTSSDQQNVAVREWNQLIKSMENAFRKFDIIQTKYARSNNDHLPESVTKHLGRLNIRSDPYIFFPLLVHYAKGSGGFKALIAKGVTNER